MLSSFIFTMPFQLTHKFLYSILTAEKNEFLSINSCILSNFLLEVLCDYFKEREAISPGEM